MIIKLCHPENNTVMHKASQPGAKNFYVSLHGQAISQHDSCHEAIKWWVDVDQLECRAKARDVRNDDAQHHCAKRGQNQRPCSTAVQEWPALCPQQMHNEGLHNISGSHAIAFYCNNFKATFNECACSRSYNPKQLLCVHTCQDATQIMHTSDISNNTNPKTTSSHHDQPECCTWWSIPESSSSQGTSRSKRQQQQHCQHCQHGRSTTEDRRYKCQRWSWWVQLWACKIMPTTWQGCNKIW